MKSAANLLLYRVVVKVLLEVVENVFEPQKIFRCRFTQRFVSCQHFLGLLPFSQGCGSERVAFRRARAVAGDLKKLIETKAGKQLPALVSINFFKSPATARALRNATRSLPQPSEKGSRPRKCWQLTKRCVKRHRKIFCGSKTFSTTSSTTFTTTR